MEGNNKDPRTYENSSEWTISVHNMTPQLNFDAPIFAVVSFTLAYAADSVYNEHDCPVDFRFPTPCRFGKLLGVVFSIGR